MRNLAERFKYIRKELGLNQAEMGKLLGVSRSAINQVEGGDTQSLKGSTLSKLVKLSGFSALWITDGKGPQKSQNGLLAMLDSLPDEDRALIEASIVAFYERHVNSQKEK